MADQPDSRCPTVIAQLRAGEWVVATGDATVGRVRGDAATGFRARLDHDDWLPATYISVVAAAEGVLEIAREKYGSQVSRPLVE